MKYLRSIFILLCLVFAISAAAEAPRKKLHIVYVTNRDRPPLPNYRERIHNIVVDVHSFFRSEMERNGHGPMTFRLDPDENRQTRIHLVTLDWDFDKERQFSPREIRPVIAESLMKKGIDIEQEYFVTFMNAYWNDNGTLKYDVVYTGSGNPIKGATWVVDHELLDAKNFDPKLTDIINDRGQKLTTGQFNVKMIGGVAHEFGHALGLPHNKQTVAERKELGTALMGSGNYTYRQERLGKKPKGSFLTPAHAFILSLHPLLNREIPDNFDIPNAFPTDLKFDVSENTLNISGKISPADELAGVVLYHDKMPTGINKDYDAFSYLAKTESNGAFSSSVPLIDTPDGCALHIKIYFKNGMHKKYSFTRDNAPDKGLESLRNGYLKAQAKYAFSIKDARMLESLIPELRALDPKEAKCAELFLWISKQWQDFKVPKDIPSTVKDVSLSSTRWKDAKVGWDIPSFNGIVEPNGRHFMPLHSSIAQCKNGLYAHAESKYEYELGAKWKKLKGRMAIQRGRREGSVVFVIKGDEKELFRSPLVKLDAGELPFEVDITGVKQLDLITECGPDGKSGDWGIWLDPVLNR